MNMYLLFRLKSYCEWRYYIRFFYRGVMIAEGLLKVYRRSRSISIMKIKNLVFIVSVIYKITFLTLECIWIYIGIDCDDVRWNQKISEKQKKFSLRSKFHRENIQNITKNYTIFCVYVSSNSKKGRTNVK